MFTPFVDNTGKPEIEFGDGTSYFGTDHDSAAGTHPEHLPSIRNRDPRDWRKHTIKFGGEFDRVQANSYFDNNINGTLTYLTLANFLTDIPFSYSQGFGNTERGNRVSKVLFRSGRLAGHAGR